MIFCSKNEAGIPKWKLVLNGQATVTRRTRLQPVGTEFAVQPARGKKAVCRAIVVSCMTHLDWIRMVSQYPPDRQQVAIANEAHCEGFERWGTLWAWLRAHHKNPDDLYRIAFEVVKP